MKKRDPETIGEIGWIIDVSLDQGNRAWYALLHDLGIEPEPPEIVNKGKPGTALYHLGAFLLYVKRAFRGFDNIGISTNGQLCPYQDCCWMCGFSVEGWYSCPNCKRPFWAETSGSDYEDWKTSRPDESRTPYNVAEAQDLGPSWGTPDGNPVQKAQL